MRYAHITGWGAYTPPRIVTNEELSHLVETSDEWIVERTGIRTRHIADAEDHTSTMAIKAGREALKVANLDPAKLDLVICATSTPDYLMPNTASLVQDGLGASHAGAFDLNAACSGFVYGLTVGAAMLRSGLYKNVLVIGAEAMSRVMDWTDRTTCVLFGDGAGAVVLEASDEPGGVMSCRLGSDGSSADVLKVALGTRVPLNPLNMVNGNGPYMKMSGNEVFRFATKTMNQVTRQVAAEAGIAVDDIDLIIPHQANQRILATAAKQLNYPIDRIYSNLERVGNTSAASIPIAMIDALKEGRLHAGDHLLMIGFGGGLTWGACLVQWSYSPEDRRWSSYKRTRQAMRMALAGPRRWASRIERGLDFWELRRRRAERKRTKKSGG
ncbi:MAG: ketoacyl-ACP synthase III [Ardenticatenales bacterium]|nr:ketoacyl-ACP synthase III [Ardenticatenales bacterium]